jgi:hypothetical protein
MNQGADLMDGNRGRFIGNGNADNFAARLLQPPDLPDGGFDIARIARGHGLNDDRRIAADPDTPEVDGFRFSSAARTH